MNAICFDPVTGASGDMILASLFDLGANPEQVKTQIESTGLSGFELEFEQHPGSDGIVYGYCKINPNEHSHTASPDETEHDHSHHDHQHNTGYRHLRDILHLLDKGDFPERAKERSAAVFRRLAEAEGAVHGKPAKDVHFHEVGAVDSIVDILGTCLALEQLEIEQIFVSYFKIGRGVLTCEHGTMPIPAPATAELLKGFEVSKLNIDAELTTPTGAALLTTLSDGNWNEIQCRMLNSGTGHGYRELNERPNIIRAYLVETPPALEIVEMIECDLDDQNGEMTALITEQLRVAGALDVVLIPTIMKKGRPGVRLSVLSPAGLSDDLVTEILSHSSTLGVRIYPVRRLTLPRQEVSRSTPWGEIQAKRVERPSGVEIIPEAEECRKLAQALNIPARKIADQVKKWEE